eukprot:10230196-Karenia_brevis.AAC.1
MAHMGGSSLFPLAELPIGAAGPSPPKSLRGAVPKSLRGAVADRNPSGVPKSLRGAVAKSLRGAERNPSGVPFDDFTEREE